jgi:hypothetical protein
MSLLICVASGGGGSVQGTSEPAEEVGSPTLAALSNLHPVKRYVVDASTILVGPPIKTTACLLHQAWEVRTNESDKPGQVLPSLH